MEYEYIDFWSQAGIGFIALDRPARLNALSFEMMAELVAVAAEISYSDLRSVILTGNGSSFSAGFDVQSLQDGLIDDLDPDRRHEKAKLGGQMADAIENLPQITVAALHGHVVGGGVVLAASCDLRVADSDTVFSIPELDLGIPLAWGGVERLVRELGPTLAKEFILTCRPFTAQEARDARFLNAITEPGGAMEVAKELAVHIAERPRLPVITTKRHVAEVLTGDMSRDDAMGLLTALDDPESTATRTAYLTRFLGQP